jgi:carbonic anhydrase/acetyltransferase-like protein (isoleucine patch superfamily)
LPKTGIFDIGERQWDISPRHFIPEGKTFPDRPLIVGVPAKLVRQLTDDDVQGLRRNVEACVRRGVTCHAQLQQID